MTTLRTCIFLCAMATATAMAHAQLEGNLLLRQVPPAGQPRWSNINRVIGAAVQVSQSTGMGTLVTVGGGGWNISNIQLYQIGFPGNTWFGNVNRAMLTVSRLTGAEPDASHDPTGASVGSNIVYSGQVGVTEDLPSGLYFRLIANTANVAPLQGLLPGNYVFSLTPFDDLHGNAFTVRADNAQQDGYIRNTQGGFGWWWGNPQQDATAWSTIKNVFTSNSPHEHEDWGIGINGSVVPVPEPATCAVLGLGALAVIRRRRKR